MTPTELELRVKKAAFAFRMALMWHNNYANAKTPEYRVECNERLTYWHKRYNELTSLGHSDAMDQVEYLESSFYEKGEK